MKDKHINDLFNKFSPSNVQKEKIYNSIAKKSKSTNQYNMKAFRTKKLLVAVSCLVIMMIVAIPFIINKQAKNVVLNNTTDATMESNANKSEFGGFVMVAYASEKKDNNLSSNYKKDNIATVLAPDVKVLLSSFSPLTSSVPGLPFTFDFNKSEGGSVTADDMVITVDNGELCTWNMETGVVNSKGRSISCKSGDTLYWSPLISLAGNKEATEDPQYDGLAKNAQITVTAMKDGKEIGKQIISITEIDNNYYAQIGNLILI